MEHWIFYVYCWKIINNCNKTHFRCKFMYCWCQSKIIKLLLAQRWPQMVRWINDNLLNPLSLEATVTGKMLKILRATYSSTKQYFEFEIIDFIGKIHQNSFIFMCFWYSWKTSITQSCERLYFFQKIVIDHRYNF